MQRDVLQYAVLHPTLHQYIYPYYLVSTLQQYPIQYHLTQQCTAPSTLYRITPRTQHYTIQHYTIQYHAIQHHYTAPHCSAYRCTAHKHTPYNPLHVTTPTIARHTHLGGYFRGQRCAVQGSGIYSTICAVDCSAVHSRQALCIMRYSVLY